MFVFANTKITLCNNILTKQYQNSKRNVSGTNIAPHHFFNASASIGKESIQQVEKQSKKGKKTRDYRKNLYTRNKSLQFYFLHYFFMLEYPMGNT